MSDTPTNTASSLDGRDGEEELTERHSEAPIYEAFARFVGNAEERASDFRMFATGYHAAAVAQEPNLSRKVDANVWKAARHLNATQSSQPEWLWFVDVRTNCIPVARYSFGRWAKLPEQAPYVRADLALASTPSPDQDGAGGGLTGGWRRTAVDGKPRRDAEFGKQWLLTWSEASATADIACIDGDWQHGEEISLLGMDWWRWLDAPPYTDAESTVDLSATPKSNSPLPPPPVDQDTGEVRE